jgi:hypothetical protein
MLGRARSLVFRKQCIARDGNEDQAQGEGTPRRGRIGVLFTPFWTRTAHIVPPSGTCIFQYHSAVKPCVTAKRRASHHDSKRDPLDVSHRELVARKEWTSCLGCGQLSKSWITAVKNWLARKDRASEITMDDLTAELRLRGLEPPYDAVKQELATRFAGMDEATQRKAGNRARNRHVHP